MSTAILKLYPNKLVWKKENYFGILVIGGWRGVKGGGGEGGHCPFLNNTESFKTVAMELGV